VQVDRLTPNDYNPNSVAPKELALLELSILSDGYTQPIVAIRNGDHYEIVDGFHRYWVGKNSEQILKTTGGRLPVVVIDKSPSERMASTVRHNRARGKHSVAGMSSMVFSMLEDGVGDVEICNELGLEPEELLRLKHITGFSKLFENVEYSRAWRTRNQIRARKSWDEQSSKDESERKFYTLSGTTVTPRPGIHRFEISWPVSWPVGCRVVIKNISASRAAEKFEGLMWHQFDESTGRISVMSTHLQGEYAPASGWRIERG
jgi:hypothetical protein